MTPSSEHRFGWRQGCSLTDLRSDVSFLSWGQGGNAAAILCALAEDSLLHGDGDSLPDGLDRAMLTMSLASQWSAAHGESAVVAYARLLADIGSDPAKRADWLGAVTGSTEGARLHSSQPVRARAAYMEALERFERLGDQKGAGRCRGNLGLLLIDHQQVEAGVRECLVAWELHAGLRYDRGVLMHLSNLVRVARDAGRWEEALHLSRERLPAVSWSEPSSLTAAYSDIGWCAWQLQRRAEAEHSYEDAVAALGHAQTAPALKAQLASLFPLAQALGRIADVESDLPRLSDQLNRRLRSLDVTHLAPSGAVLNRVRAALETDDRAALHAALAQSQCWSSFTFERVLAEHATHALIDDQQRARELKTLARRLALAYARSFLDRAHVDEYALYSAWTFDTCLMKARAYALKLDAIRQATAGDHDAARASLDEARELHTLIGDRDAVGSWFPEADQELGVDRTRMHRLMFRASQESFLGARDDAERTLMELLGLAEQQGTTLDRADACTRLGIHHAEADSAAAAAEYFERAETAFRKLETLGISVREEAGRAHNKLKMAVHLLEFLARQGRYGEAAYVGVAALREVDWFIESFQHPEYGRRAMDYKSRLLHGLAGAYERLGAYETAILFADRLREWSGEVGDKAALGAAHHSRAQALRSLFRLSDALASAEADLDVQRELGDAREIAVALILCAEIAGDLGDGARARRFATEAMEHASAAPNAASSMRDAKYVLARLAEGEGALSQAIQLYAEVLAGEEAEGGTGWVATASVLAERLLKAGRFAEARSMARRSWEAAAVVQSPSLRVSAGCALARCHLAVDDADAVRQAIEVLLECCGLVERIRGEMADEAHKTSAAGAWVLPFELLLSTLLRVTAIDAAPAWTRLAFEVAERAKARALAESIAASAARAAEAQAFQLTSLSVRPVDRREEIGRVEFTAVRDMLRRETEATSLRPRREGGIVAGGRAD